MLPQVDTKNVRAVEAQIASLWRALLPEGDAAFVPRAFAWAEQCFSGRYASYLPIDARYHDFEHTLQGTLCFVRLLVGRQRAAPPPPLSGQLLQLGLLAILFHDTGYLKLVADREGTGAKYTLIHVGRSAEFAGVFLQERGLDREEIAAVQNMISCTGVNADLGAIPFQSEAERVAGFALGTADLLGQMAAPDYVDKLPVLYLEFVEAARFSGEKGARFAVYADAEDLMRRTPGFWQNYVWPKINADFFGLYRFLNAPYPDGPNPYLLAVEANMARLAKRFATADR